MKNRPMPQEMVPELNVNLISGEEWDLKDQNPDLFTMIVFYRGLHCPVCEKYLKILDGLLEDYKVKGVDVIAISMDNKVRARTTGMKWGLSKKLPLGYGLNEDTARSWGLYLSKAIKEYEPDIFVEPGLFLVKPDGTLYFTAINSTPWGRPHLPSFLQIFDFIKDSGYPARGEYF